MISSMTCMSVGDIARDHMYLNLGKIPKRKVVTERVDQEHPGSHALHIVLALTEQNNPLSEPHHIPTACPGRSSEPEPSFVTRPPPLITTHRPGKQACKYRVIIERRLQTSSPLVAVLRSINRGSFSISRTRSIRSFGRD